MFNSTNSDLKEFISKVDEGYNPELKPLKAAILERRDKLYTMRQNSIMYQDVYIAKIENEMVAEISKMRDDIYQFEIDKLTIGMGAIKNRFKKELSDSEVNKKLLELKQFESKLKFYEESQLQDLLNDFRNGNSTLDVDKLYLLGVELKARQYDSEAAFLHMMMKENNVEEPWLNDEEYKSAQATINRYRGKLGRGYIDLDLVKDNVLLGYSTLVYIPHLIG